MDRPAYFEEFSELSKRGEFEEIIARSRDKLSHLQRSGHSNQHETALLYRAKANAHCDLCDYFSALSEFENALRCYRAIESKPTDPMVCCLLFIGRMLAYTGRPAEAEDRLHEALILLDHMPEDEQHGRAFIYTELASLHRRFGELDIAEQLLLQALSPMQKFYSFGSIHFASIFWSLALVYQCQKREFAEERTFKKAITFARFSFDLDETGLAMILSSNGLRLLRLGRIEEALTAQQEAFEILSRTRKPGHKFLDTVRVRLSKVQAALNSPSKPKALRTSCTPLLPTYRR